jgi:hypothetical protein
MVAAPARADEYKTLDARRAAGGLGVNALYDQGAARLYAVPDAWLSWSLTENMALKAGQEWNTDKGFAPLRVGARLYVPDSTKAYRVGIGANYLYDWKLPGHDWSVGLYAGWEVAKNLAAQASYEKVVEANRNEYRLGLAYKAFGGK